MDNSDFHRSDVQKFVANFSFPLADNDDDFVSGFRRLSTVLKESTSLPVVDVVVVVVVEATQIRWFSGMATPLLLLLLLFRSWL